MIVQDVTKYVENRTGHSLNRDEGIHHGNGEQIVKGATVAWMATPDAIRAAGEARHELLIVHESLYYPYDVVIAPDPPADWEDWQVNRQRRSLLEQYDLNLVRIHGSADEICILDLFAKVLGLENEVFSDEQYLKIY
ncbi:MAG: hypothetical protein KAS17_00235, partial [Victivallaceae bacterium]|nr:hypothetical protein [Victivallaceae bacterium]